MLPKLHLAKDAFALQLFLQRSQSLVDVVIANKYLHETFPSLNRDAPLGLQCALSMITLQRVIGSRSEADQFISPIF